MRSIKKKLSIGILCLILLILILIFQNRFLPKKLVAYVGDSLGNIAKIDVKTHKILKTATPVKSEFRYCKIAITPDGKKLFVAGGNYDRPDCPLLVVDASSLSVIKEVKLPIIRRELKEEDFLLPGETSIPPDELARLMRRLVLPPVPEGITITPDGKKLILTSYEYDHTFPTFIIDTKTYEVLTKSKIRFTTRQSDPIFSPDSKTLYVAVPYLPLRILNLDTYEMKEKWLFPVDERLADDLRQIPGENKALVGTGYWTGGNKTASGKFIYRLALLDLSSLEVEELDFRREGRSVYIRISPDGKQLYDYSIWDDLITVLDRKTLNTIATIPIPEGLGRASSSADLTFTPDGRKIFFPVIKGTIKRFTEPGQILVIDTKTNQIIDTIKFNQLWELENVVFGYESYINPLIIYITEGAVLIIVLATFLLIRIRRKKKTVPA